jgi:hypothetical protein
MLQRIYGKPKDQALTLEGSSTGLMRSIRAYCRYPFPMQQGKIRIAFQLK